MLLFYHIAKQGVGLSWRDVGAILVPPASDAGAGECGPSTLPKHAKVAPARYNRYAVPLSVKLVCPDSQDVGGDLWLGNTGTKRQKKLLSLSNTVTSGESTQH